MFDFLVNKPSYSFVTDANQNKLPQYILAQTSSNAKSQSGTLCSADTTYVGTDLKQQPIML